ncbi:MAG: phenylacetate-CoA oxygenase subunit PaaC [Chloroflexi bacterium AL-W]|nr:phenylacetate-CoA oxygenase subunit PaaC [Blastochloris sp.]NOK64289.1 phenylacetate-CoA oxygenase subunit PaaC [Chloroflexi bacterium AL-N1]NOK71534.1 phenylacetate-CoA oxygenase subunit PaaC [Chloroflexi bacterium AL-N10]NOK78880.1 phenylacetate-CoA oxygenase subunit PaaC [Chloroflexi bacterium AL-N5]NOK86356.1 phenylacetate-CoA oxygenase subunit PaaC [Chloroflexi bacterium AL-W]NOK93325.1 phenylacetate-CoA oxygenase subunit PaaC [Chloroflexi bacterium AL-N15]
MNTAVEPVTNLTPVQKQALCELLLALADDEFVMGYANSEWTGIAPILEEDIAFSSLAQDEIGHSRVFYEMLATLEEQSADSIAYGREPSGFRNAQLVERGRGDWAYSVTRQFFYDTADFVRIESLQKSTYQPLAKAAAGIIREEKYHLLHANTWLQRLAEGNAEAQQRQHTAFDALWPDALGLFEPTSGATELLATGILPEPFEALQNRWITRIEEPLRRLSLPFPFIDASERWDTHITPIYGGRRGEHTQSFLDLYSVFTSVYQLDPEADW